MCCCCCCCSVCWEYLKHTHTLLTFSFFFSTPVDVPWAVPCLAIHRKCARHTTFWWWCFFLFKKRREPHYHWLYRRRREEKLLLKGSNRITQHHPNALFRSPLPVNVFSLLIYKKKRKRETGGVEQHTHKKGSKLSFCWYVCPLDEGFLYFWKERILLLCGKG